MIFFSFKLIKDRSITYICRSTIYIYAEIPYLYTEVCIYIYTHTHTYICDSTKTFLNQGLEKKKFNINQVTEIATERYCTTCDGLGDSHSPSFYRAIYMPCKATADPSQKVFQPLILKQVRSIIRVYWVTVSDPLSLKFI